MQNKNEGDYLLMKTNKMDTHTLVEQQVWYTGNYFEQESGEKCYFSCQHLQETYNASQGKTVYDGLYTQKQKWTILRNSAL